MQKAKQIAIIGFLSAIADIFKDNKNAMVHMERGGQIVSRSFDDMYYGGSHTFKRNRRAELRATSRRRHRAGVKCAAR